MSLVHFRQCCGQRMKKESCTLVLKVIYIFTQITANNYFISFYNFFCRVP